MKISTICLMAAVLLTARAMHGQTAASKQAPALPALPAGFTPVAHTMFSELAQPWGAGTGGEKPGAKDACFSSAPRTAVNYGWKQLGPAGQMDYELRLRTVEGVAVGKAKDKHRQEHAGQAPYQGGALGWNKATDAGEGEGCADKTQVTWTATWFALVNHHILTVSASAPADKDAAQKLIDTYAPQLVELAKQSK